MRIGLLGGTGVEGRGLALRFAAARVEVAIGSRSRERSTQTARQLNGILGAECIRGATNAEVLADSEIILLTVPFDKAAALVQSLKQDFRAGHLIVDATVPLTFASGRAEYFEQGDRSNAELLAAQLPPGIDLVGAFKTIPARILAEVDLPLDCDVFVCGDSQSAKDRVMAVASLIPSLRPVDAGPLMNARILERMTVLAVQLNRRYKSKGARFRVVGI